MMIDLSKLTTEQRNPYSMQIDSVSTLDMLKIINEEDKKVPIAVGKVLPQIAEAVDVIATAMQHGGRLFYIGAGTSGRLGILDAVECPPTYSTEPELVQGLIAGGVSAIFKAKEGAEDDLTLAQKDLEQAGFNEKDVLVGIAASGRTPYVIGGLKFANRIGAKTIAVSCSEGSEIASIAQIAITPIVGPEVVTGSTRMKAGTAQKLVLNMLSTGTMIKLGKVYGNLMVDVKTSNKKLEERARRIVMEATGCTRDEAIAALAQADGKAKLAILLELTHCTADEGKTLLAKAQGRLGTALQLKKAAQA